MGQLGQHASGRGLEPAGKAAGWERILSTIEKIASAMAKD
jgi:hypothetical protein